MKLYGLKNAPNPRRVKIFLAEKKISLPLEELDIETREHKTPAFLAKNSLGQLPVLELDDGALLTEGPVIMQYLADRQPHAGLAQLTQDGPSLGRRESCLVKGRPQLRKRQVTLASPALDQVIHPGRARLVIRVSDTLDC